VPHSCVRGLPRMWGQAMSMWNQDLELITTDELEGLCDELEMKLDEGRAELVRREEEKYA